MFKDMRFIWVPGHVGIPDQNVLGAVTNLSPFHSLHSILNSSIHSPFQKYLHLKLNWLSWCLFSSGCYFQFPLSIVHTPVIEFKEKKKSKINNLRHSKSTLSTIVVFLSLAIRFPSFPSHTLEVGGGVRVFVRNEHHSRLILLSHFRGCFLRSVYTALGVFGLLLRYESAVSRCFLMIIVTVVEFWFLQWIPPVLPLAPARYTLLDFLFIGMVLKRCYGCLLI